MEGAKLAIYDERVSYQQIKIDLNGQEELNNGKDNDSSWTFSVDILETTKDADAIIILTESDEFKSLNWEKISKNMRFPCWLFDTRGVVDKAEVLRNKINFWSVGSGDLITKNIY